MATRAWDTVPIYGWWRLSPNTPLPPGSKVRFTLAGTDRVRRVDGRMIYPGGLLREVTIGNPADQDDTIKARIHDAMRAKAAALPGFDSVAWEAQWTVSLGDAIFTDFYATDDPDVTPNGWQVKVEERLSGATGKVYFVEPLVAQIDPVGDVPGINLAMVEVPPGAPNAPAPVYAKGQPGGVAALNTAGDVVNARGEVITPGGGGGGADGASAYEIAVDNGFVGTEAEWLESLKGEPGDTGGGEAGPLAEFTALPGSPVAWLPYQFRLTAGQALPSGITWATGAPVIGGWGIIILVWDGAAWRGEWAEMDPTPLPDTTAPAWSATLTTGTPTQTSVTVTASALATDNIAVTGYERSLDSGATWATITPTGNVYTITGLTASTAYPAPRFRAKDAAGNSSAVLTAQAFTTAAPVADTTAPVPGLLAASGVTSTGFTLTVTGASDAGAGLNATPYRFSTDNGTTWTAWQAPNVYAVTGRTAATAYQCKHEVRDAAATPNTGAGAAITVTTSAAPPSVVITDSFTRADSTTTLGSTDTGQAWTVDGTLVMGITANKAYRVSGAGAATVDVGVPNMAVEAQAPTSRSLTARYTDPQNFYFMTTGSPTYVMVKIDGSNTTYPATTMNSTTGDTLRLEVVEEGTGSRVTAKVNGSEILNVLEERANRPMGTRAGMHTTGTGVYDNFRAESL